MTDVGEEALLLQHAVFTTILDLHPEHLTVGELVLKMRGERQPFDDDPIREAIRDLRGCGLLRPASDVVEPTHAAVRAAEILDWP